MKTQDSLATKASRIILAAILALSCLSITSLTALASAHETRNQAYADDCFYSGDWHGEWRYGSKGWWYRLNDYQFAIHEWTIGDNTYYFDNQGWMKTGWQYYGDGSNEAWHYFNSNGEMVTKWKQIDGAWYYFDRYGRMTTGWNLIKPTWYYHSKSGAMATGWQLVHGKWYYFDNSGAMETDRWIGNYYLTSDGSMATNQWIGKYHVNAVGLWDKTDNEGIDKDHASNPYDAKGKLKAFTGVHTGVFSSTNNSYNCTNSIDKTLTIDFKKYDPGTNTYTADITFLLHFCDLWPDDGRDRFRSDYMVTVRNIEIDQWALLNGGIVGHEQAYVDEDNNGSNRRVDFSSDGLDLSTGQVNITVCPMGSGFLGFIDTGQEDTYTVKLI